MYIRMHMHTHAYAGPGSCTSGPCTCMHAHAYVCARKSICTCAYACVHTCIRACACAHMYGRPHSAGPLHLLLRTHAQAGCCLLAHYPFDYPSHCEKQPARALDTLHMPRVERPLVRPKGGGRGVPGVYICTRICIWGGGGGVPGVWICTRICIWGGGGGVHKGVEG